MATLQNFDAEIEKTRQVVEQVRGKMGETSVALDQFAKAANKCRAELQADKRSAP